MPSKKRKFGDIGEKTAANYLATKGFRIVTTNYQKPWGEIDIVAEKAAKIHFVEVKSSYYYPNPSFTPEIRVNWRKQKQLKRICETYLAEIRAPQTQEWKIDVISVILNEDDSVCEVNHIENAVFERQY